MAEHLGQIIDIAHRDFKHAYKSNSGYIVPTAPKHGWQSVGDFSLETLQEAENGYLQMTSFVSESMPHLLTLKQDKELARNATARITHSSSKEKLINSADNTLFNLHLQKGRVFNFPYLKISQAFGLDLEDTRVVTNNGGDTVETIISILNTIQAQIDRMGIERENQYRYLALVVFVGGSFKEQWQPYIESDITMEELMFAFNPNLTRLYKAPLPLSHVRDWMTLPREWVLKMIEEEK